MTERLADISARIDGIEKLGSVVNAMRGVAASRSRQAQAELAAVDSYAGAIKAAISRILPMAPAPDAGHGARPPRRAMVAFLAEEGFVGNFSEKMLDALADRDETAALLLVGARGGALARERGLKPVWQGAVPSRTASIPKLADMLAEAIYRGVADGSVETLDVLYAAVGAAGAVETRQMPLLPFDPLGMPGAAGRDEPLLQLPPADLLDKLAGEYLHAQLCRAALHAFAAENQARMLAMARTHGEVDRMLDALQVRQRIVRQEEITAEIIELAAGETASRRTTR
jgi:F-type H+-transporting ATPase subunit gamma